MALLSVLSSCTDSTSYSPSTRRSEMGSDACALGITHCLQYPFQIRGPWDGPHGPMLWDSTAYEHENKVVRRAKMPLCSAYFMWFNCIILIWVHYSLVCYSNKLHCSLKQWWLKIEILNLISDWHASNLIFTTGYGKSNPWKVFTLWIKSLNKNLEV